MRTIIVSALTVALPGIAAAHTSVVEHAHPHEAAHPYLGLDGLALMAGVAAVAGLVLYALRGKRSGG